MPSLAQTNYIWSKYLDNNSIIGLTWVTAERVLLCGTSGQLSDLFTHRVNRVTVGYLHICPN